MLDLNWIRCGNDHHWCDLARLNLDMDTFGVYVIWHEGNPGRVGRIGQGDIAERLATHRTDRTITQYASNGALRVTWAAVPASQTDGVERYLADHLDPLIGDAFPTADPIAVRLPW